MIVVEKLTIKFQCIERWHFLSQIPRHLGNSNNCCSLIVPFIVAVVAVVTHFVWRFLSAPVGNVFSYYAFEYTKLFCIVGFSLICCCFSVVIALFIVGGVACENEYFTFWNFQFSKNCALFFLSFILLLTERQKLQRNAIVALLIIFTWNSRKWEKHLKIFIWWVKISAADCKHAFTTEITKQEQRKNSQKICNRRFCLQVEKHCCCCYFDCFCFFLIQPFIHGRNKLSSETARKPEQKETKMIKNCCITFHNSIQVSNWKKDAKYQRKMHSFKRKDDESKLQSSHQFDLTVGQVDPRECNFIKTEFYRVENSFSKWLIQSDFETFWMLWLAQAQWLVAKQFFDYNFPHFQNAEHSIRWEKQIWLWLRWWRAKWKSFLVFLHFFCLSSVQSWSCSHAGPISILLTHCWDDNCVWHTSTFDSLLFLQSLQHAKWAPTVDNWPAHT